MNKKVWKYLKISLITLLISIILIISTALIIIFFYEDKIKDVIVSELNENLNTEIVVKNIDLELFKKFPNASITFKEVTIKDAIPDSVKGDLFTAKRIYLLFSVIDIFTGNYNISKIECKEGFAKILIYKNGKDNYHFWKEINDSISDNQRVNPLVVNLKKLIFNDMGFYFKDFKKAQQFNGLINKLYFKGNFSKDIYDMSVNGDVFVNKISNKDDNFISNNSVEISSNINVDNTTNKYTITEGKLILEKIVFNIDGFLIYNDLTQFIDAKLTGENIEILTVINSLPATYSAYLDKYKTKGIIQLSSTVKGEIKTGKIPEIKAFFTLSDGYFKEKTRDISLHDIQLSGSYNNKNDQNISNDLLIINNFTAILDENNSIQGNIKIDGFVQPKLELYLKTTLDLSKLKEFLSFKKIENLNGKLELKGIYKTQLSDLSNFTAQNFINSKSEGYFKIKDFEFKHIDYPYIYKTDGEFSFNNNDIIIKEMKGYIGKTDYLLKGYFKNIMSFLFTKNANLSIVADLKSKNTYLEDFLIIEKSNPNTQNDESSYKLTFNENINLNLELMIDSLSFEHFRANNISGDLLLKNQKMLVNNLIFNAMNGEVSGKLSVDGTKAEKLFVNCDTRIKDVDISELFYQFNNFGLSVLTDENITGITTTNVQFKSEWTTDLKINENSIYVNADICIDDGKLIDYKPIKGLEKFIKEDLSVVSFSSLKNNIIIKEKIVYIPEMFVKSSAMDFEISGEHNFNNEINYHLKILLPALKVKKESQQQQEEFGNIKDDGLGKTKLYILITGTVDDPKYKQLDKEMLVKEVKKNIKEEKQTLKNILNKEFGWFKKDSTVIEQTEEKQTQNRFTIEWDEN